MIDAKSALRRSEQAVYTAIYEAADKGEVKIVYSGYLTQELAVKLTSLGYSLEYANNIPYQSAVTIISWGPRRE